MITCASQTTLTFRNILGLTYMSTRGPIVRQSSFDGLCGIYCLVNTVRNWHRFNGPTDPDTLRYLLEAVERLGIFSVHRVMGGFEAHELVDIFNEFARAHGYPAKAQLLNTLADELPAKRSSTVDAKPIFEQGGQIIASVDNGRHWVLCYGYNRTSAKILFEDPAPGKTEVAFAGSKVKSDGVIISPIDCVMSLSIKTGKK